MAAPLIVATALMLATVTLALLAWKGGTAEGARLRIELTGTCGEQAIPILVARMQEMGLGEAQATSSATGVTLVATMPGSAENEADHIPAMLARQGLLTAGPPAQPTFTGEGVEEAQIRLDESGLPYTWLTLSAPALESLKAAAAADPEGVLTLRLDAIDAPPRPHSKPINDGGIRLLPGEGITRERMQVAADHAIVLTHGPLPCPLTVGSVTEVATPSGGR